MAAMPASHLLVIDDHAMFRSGLAVLLRMGIPDLVVSEAGSIAEALQHTLARPDVVLLDIVLKGLNGLEGMELLKRQWPATPIVMVSSDADPATIRQAMTRGAAAFVSKEQSAENILMEVQRVLRPPALGTDVQETDAVRSDDAKGLTPRQLEVLDFLCQGLPNKAIGRKLHLSENTVRWHVQGILAYLQVSNRSEAAFAARKQGLIG